MAGTYSARDVKCCVAARIFNLMPEGVRSTPTFATHAASHVYLLFNKIQRHISDLADGTRLVRAIRRHATGTRTMGSGSVCGGAA